MSGLTKDQLKNELITHGVELPSSSAKKEEYLRLYEKYVAPVEQSKGEFSSDDEDSPIAPAENQIIMEQSLFVDGLDIANLDDDELFSRLQEFGASVGPIVDTTRKVYQKKLAVLMGGDVVDSPTYNGDVDEEEYSDNDEVEEKEEMVVTRQTAATTSSPQPTEMTDIRRRVLLSSAGESPKDDMAFDPDRHTPSPRRSLRSVTSSSTTTTHTYETNLFRNLNNGRSGGDGASGKISSVEEEEEQDQKSKISLIVRLIVKLLFLALIIALIAYVYQNDPNESPFKAVEQLARQALEAAVGEEAGGAEDEIQKPTAPPAEVPAQ